MKSIYSIKVLQSILDHWGVGRIEDTTYFEKVGRNIWRHYIETNQGNFELYSYPVSESEYAEVKLKEFVEDRHWHHLKQFQRTKIIHSFDRYHKLIQFSKKHKITAKQAYKDLDLLIGLTIKKAFRVYGSIFQIHLYEIEAKKAGVLVSYGWWSIQDYKKGRANVIVDSRIHSYEQLDNAIELVEQAKPIIKKYVLKDGWFELYLSNGMSLHFGRADTFPAIEVHLNNRKNDLLVFNENELFYTKDFRDQ